MLFFLPFLVNEKVTGELGLDLEGGGNSQTRLVQSAASLPPGLRRKIETLNSPQLDIPNSDTAMCCGASQQVTKRKAPPRIPAHGEEYVELFAPQGGPGCRPFLRPKERQVL